MVKSDAAEACGYPHIDHSKLTRNRNCNNFPNTSVKTKTKFDSWSCKLLDSGNSDGIPVSQRCLLGRGWPGCARSFFCCNMERCSTSAAASFSFWQARTMPQAPVYNQKRSYCNASSCFAILRKGNAPQALFCRSPICVARVFLGLHYVHCEIPRTKPLKHQHFQRQILIFAGEICMIHWHMTTVKSMATA